MRVAPWAWAASSTRASWCCWASAVRSPIAAGCPKRWTGITAAVRGVIAARTASGSRQNVSGLMSAKTTAAPVSRIAPAVPAEGKGRDDHLVAEPDAQREKGQPQGGSAGVDRDAVVAVDQVRELVLEGRDLGALDEMAGPEYADSGGDVGLIQARCGNGNQLGIQSGVPSGQRLMPTGWVAGRQVCWRVGSKPYCR